MTKLLQAHLALFIVNLIYGANYLIAKGLMPDLIGPSGFVQLRVAGAVLLFWVVYVLFVRPPDQKIAKRDSRYLHVGPEPVMRKDLWRLAFCGLTGVAVNQLLFFHGLNLTSPINSAIIMTSNPIMVVVLSALILRERIPALRITGVVLGFVGAVSLILLSKTDQAGNSSALGDLFILLNSASYAVYLVSVKPLMSKYRPITVISWVFLFGSLMVLPIGWSQLTEVDWSAFGNWELFSAFYVVVAVTFLAYLLNIVALKSVSPTVASAYIYLQPVMAGLFAALFAVYFSTDYTSDITWLKVLCTLLIFTGVYLVSRPVVKKLKPEGNS